MILKRNHYILAGVIGFFSLYYMMTRERVILSDVHWSCNHVECKVDFQIENRTREKVGRRVAIRAFRHRSTGKSAIISDIVGESEQDVSLYSGEKRAFSERVALMTRSRVDLVSVSQYEPRKK